MGHPYERGISYLKDFDRFCLLNFRNATCLDEKVCLAWARRRPTENNSGFISRITPLRQLGKFLNSIGIQAYVLPDSFHGHVPRYLPHIFTEEELRSFFTAVDSLAPYYQSVARHLVAPVLFRLMYCCGLRPSEARLLENADIDLWTGRTLIRQSKGHKDRIIIIPPDLLETCRTYRLRVQCLFPDSKFFFPNHNGNTYSAPQLRYLFELCWSKAGIEVYDLPKPRVYDFRHTYCTYRLYRWMDEGRDITAWLPYLSAFLGHEDYGSTAYYIHLVPGALQRMSGFDLNKLECLIPEVSF
ncbi:tyrosine-type recombinase/integrase [Alicyclobacillus tolerans]|uniref:tyrosine-type recombinase/integrase n=1 Tax=Alicyclobacillus tolerans TaxID=90970 RepID=UPI0035562E40|nr:tyrosine-type recombinase/integrase [Alicyclobacillus tolerans]